ncbi:mutarotase [Flavobacterium cellulosilyticum]|uniref:Mutarotase n=1 Tax=Flavobacterium cellulosilyticum TaxID=2541731 RepID=A0A4R5CAV8_9FLAO|nr:mutarotase [Flavobacterium cellulosilyticum]TDD97068.1 mutarotase [Flavobacterium cellulosilyticum]
MHRENLNQLYGNLHDKTSIEILKGNYFIDELIDSPNDQRFGLTLLIRPSEKIKIEIENFLNKSKEIEPEEYYYPKSDMHITVLSIISCHSDFNISKISVNQYSDIISKSFNEVENFEIEFKGITLSNSGVLIKGFPTNDSLNNLRDNLRSNFKKEDLENSIDSRYSISTAHITTIRFRKKLKNPKNFLIFLEQYKNYNFGTLKVENIELVSNDWYLREKNVKKLNQFII